VRSHDAQNELPIHGIHGISQSAFHYVKRLREEIADDTRTCALIELLSSCFYSSHNECRVICDSKVNLSCKNVYLSFSTSRMLFEAPGELRNRENSGGDEFEGGLHFPSSDAS